MRVTVVGAGYVGISTAVTLAYTGHHVTCLDVDAARIAALTRNELPLYEPWLPDLLALARPNLRYATDYADAVPDADIIMIAVGTPPGDDGQPDLSHVRAVARAIGEHLGETFTTVIVKSTVPIGGGVMVAALVGQAAQARAGSRSGPPFAVASNPEFLREGWALHDSLYPERIVIGTDHPASFEALFRLYRPVLEQTFHAPPFLPRPEGLSTVPLLTMDMASAELTKYAANAFLALKISFINEIATLAERVGADVTRVSHGIGLDQRIGSRFLQAGIGWGGSCFGKDTGALIAIGHQHGVELPVVQVARAVNYRQRERMVEKLLEYYPAPAGLSVGLLGLAFKPRTDDLRDAPALDLARRLLALGVEVRAHDPVALARARREYADLGVRFHNDVASVAAGADAVILVTEWPEYHELPWEALAATMRGRLILDGRNFLDRERLARAGCTYVGVGRA
jgi:UDPglucose 6-dehydrogenase